ncbi:CLUMA_CG021224, isoform A [Clunio marinus]|uniref:DNA methyltransferase 1-associated protein 1 n=1 Tax=Clunio marinus TaxID=568069 RepID=A0A1J1J8I4_9DIPT|nr:CLUMA_CG021224, isoform A [Clunio marinus]
MGDMFREILNIEQPSSQELTKETLITKKKPLMERTKTTRRPEGMHREVYALLYKDNKDAPPLLPTDTGLGYKQAKARLGMKKVRKWEWKPFVNPARNDGVQFCHWQRATDEAKEYPFAKLNRQLNIPTYTLNEYNTHLRLNTKWNKAQTDHLFELAQRFDTRFVIMADRWDKNFGVKTVEDLKERYYEVNGILQKLRGNANGDKKIYVFDGEHERKRKEQLKKLFERTQEQIEEETMLQNEMRKIEARKKEREKKTQDLQKLISQADQQSEQAAATAPQARKQEKKLNKKKIPVQQKMTKADVVSTMETANIRFGEGVNKGTGITMRSQKMKLPANFGQKRTKALEQMLAEFKVDPNPPAIEEICTAFNELRSDMILLHEIRTALASSEYELETLKQMKQEIIE